MIVASNCFLPHGFINTYRTGHRNIEALYDTHLWNDKISIGQCPDFFTYPIMFIAKYQCGADGKINIIQTYRISTKICGKDFAVSFPKLCKTFICISILVNGKPFSGTAAAFGAKFFMWVDLGS